MYADHTLIHVCTPRRFVSDLERFERQGFSIPQVDMAFLMSCGYDTAMEETIEYVRDDGDTAPTMPIFMSYKRFRNVLVPQLSRILMPSPPPGPPLLHLIRTPHPYHKKQLHCIL